LSFPAKSNICENGLSLPECNTFYANINKLQT
jgi:hypothetical protein